MALVNHQYSQQSQSAQVAIIGAGPVGLELAAAFKQASVPYLHFEARQIGYTLTWWPRNTHFFSTTERIALAGIPIQNQSQDRITGEEYLAYLRALVEQLDLQVNTFEPVIGIEQADGGFRLTTSPMTGKRTYTVQKVVFANGGMDAPNRLGIPGEDLPFVSHYFHDPHDYFRQRLLIVGGRNSAVEAALRCWRAGSQVTISYRRPAFLEDTVKHWLLPDLCTQIELGNIAFLPETRPVEIRPGEVILKNLRDGSQFVQATDFVLLNTGFVADPTLLKLAGVRLIGEQQAPEYNPETMESNIPGIYICGTVAAGTQTKYRLFIENSHEHVGKIVQHLTGRWPEKLGTVPQRQYDLPLEEIQAN